ncbi:MAG: glycosyltransferase family 39 protein [Chloroflexi bacterium]|nr:glycosyltransferase family 39 protein [Chloroflexota bacterium]
MQKIKLPLWLSILLLLALIVPSHLVGLDKFATLDEPWWAISGSNYYYALTHRDFANTIYDYHPAVTTTWVVTAGMLTVFPEYRGFGQGYFDVRKPNYDEFLQEHDVRTLDVLRNSRIIQSVLLIGLALLAFFLLQLFIDRPLALAAVAFAFDAPFFLGHSRLINHEGMLTLFVAISILGAYVYVNVQRKPVYLLLSGAAFGLAQLTKSPSIVVMGIVGLMLFVGLFERGKPFGAKLWDAVKVMAIWLGAALLVYVALWPGMWVAANKMFYEVYGNAFSYAFQGARLDVTQELEPRSFDLDNGLSGVTLYLQRLGLRTTPLTWLGLLLAVPSLFMSRVKPVVKTLIGYLVLTSALFILMFGIAKGRDSAHYILTSFFLLDLIAALGWGAGLSWLGERWSRLGQTRVQGGLLALLVLAQLAVGLSFYPYYFTYGNPLVARTPADYASGYGEGLDQAAAYLAQKQDADGLRVFAYSGMGPFSYFFPGRTEVMKKAYFWEPGIPSVVSGMRWSEYVVVYAVVQENLPECAAFLEAMQSVEPEHVVTIHGMEYARIYRSADIPESVYEALSK